MRKFVVAKKSHKKAYPKALHLGEIVNIHGVDRSDSNGHLYYNTKLASKHSAKLTAVRGDKLRLIK